MVSDLHWYIKHWRVFEESHKKWVESDCWIPIIKTDKYYEETSSNPLANLNQSVIVSIPPEYL